MNDSLFDPQDSKLAKTSNIEELSVSELSQSLKKTVEDRFGYVRVRGEISGFRGQHSSGHCYFSLKDDRARLEAVIWKGVFGRLKHKPEEGLEVIASGKLTTYPGSSKYQIVIDNLEPAGAGALMALLEERKKKLEAEGLFAPGRKQLLPYMPKVIGVVTSPTGAVIRDVLHRLSDRFPLHVLVWPVRVQGETTGQEVSNAIRGFNAIDAASTIPRPDVLIVARGGGSVEDLWGFNDEAVVRAAADSDIPLISAVGHETDWTLLDYVADVRAPTPTGAAEMAVPVKADLEAHLATVGARQKAAISRNIERARTELRSAARGLASPDMLLAMPSRRLDEASTRLGNGLSMATQAKRSQFAAVAGRGLPRPDTILREPGDRLTQLSKRFERGLSLLVENKAMQLALLSKRVTPNSLVASSKRNQERLSGLLQRLKVTEGIVFENKKARLQQAGRLIENLSHKSVLARGFAVVRDGDGNPVISASGISAGEVFSAELSDGVIDGIASGTGGKSPKPKQAAKPKTQSAGKSDTEQGSLFQGLE